MEDNLGSCEGFGIGDAQGFIVANMVGVLNILILDIDYPMCCALCPGAVDWHNDGNVRNIWECGWDCFLNTLLTLCTILWTIEGPSIIVL